MRIGIYQGRLTNTKILQKFPKDWVKEFDHANLLGYDHIEFFLEKKINSKNPIWKKKEMIINKIKTLKNKRAIVCDNYSIYNSILEQKNVKYIEKTINHLSKLPKPKLIIPLNKDLFNEENLLIRNLKYISNFAKKKQVEISFECDFDSKKIIYLSKKIKNFKVTFDTGNVFLLEKNINTSFKRLKYIINHIHVKDRNKLKMNVVLGTGLINFDSFFKLIKKYKYNRDVTLETNRGNDAIMTGHLNLVLIKKLINF